MVHLPWCFAQGNALDLERQISTLEQLKKSMISIYKTKFRLSDDEIAKLLEEETWIDSSSIAKYKLDAEVVGTPAVKIAAKIKKNFKNIPKELISMETLEQEQEESKKLENAATEEGMPEDEEEDGKAEGAQAEGSTEDEDKEEGAAQAKDEADGQQDDKDEDDQLEQLANRVAELERENEELKKQLDAPVEDRVRGMQSKMAKQLNTQKAEYSAKIEDFQNQLRAKAEELTQMKAEVTSLNDKLENATKELSKTTSALVEKSNALATLNAGVNKPSEAKPPMTKAQARQKLATMPLAQRAEFYKLNKDLIDG